MPRSSYYSIVLLAAAYAHAQEIKFERISLEQGLSQSSVFSIAQDLQGFMWFATQDGLNRYDGYSFTVFRNDPRDSTSLSDNYVTAVCVDHEGVLWAGTRGAGLNRFVRETGKFTRHESIAGDVRSLSDNQVRRLYVDMAGALWIGTANGLNRFERKTGDFTRFVHNPMDPKSLPAPLVESVFEDSRGNFWVGLLHALALMDRSNGQFSSVARDPSLSLFRGFGEDSAGRLWFATQEGLFFHRNDHWIPGKRELKTRTPLTARTILRDSKGNMWFGSDAGLWRYSPSLKRLDTYVHETENPHSLSGNSILSLLEDRTGILWIGTFDGINKYAPEKFKFDYVAMGGGGVRNAGWNKIRGFCEDRVGNIWLATQEGLMTFDRRTRALAPFPTDSWYSDSRGTRLLWSLLDDRHAVTPTLWIGTNGQGLIKMESRTSQRPIFTKYEPRVNDPSSLSGPSATVIYETKDGALWIGTLVEGLNRFDRRRGTFTRYTHDPANPKSISSNEIWAILEDRRGNLWVGTAGGGLNKLNAKAGTFERFSHNPQDHQSLSNDKVLAIFEDDAGEFWIGTYSGLNRFDPATGVFTHFTVEEGLANNVVYGILPDGKGNLWLSTNNGLSRFTIESKKVRNYDINDGLQSNEFNHGAAFRDKNGMMYFGGVNGFNVFDPEKIQDNSNVPEVVFTDFKVFDKSLRPSRGESRILRHISQANAVYLTYSDAVFSIEFAGLEYTNPLKNQYAYKMEGFDDEWRAGGSKREVTYTNLDPGDYVFRVRASNNDGVWNERGASLLITITPPFWATWWFRGLGIFGFLSVGPIVYYRRITTLKKEKIRQEQVSRLLIEHQENERTRIARELHDSLGQELLIIKNRALMGLQSAKDTDEKMRQQFDNIASTVTKSLKTVREISHNLRPPELDRLGLTETLRSILREIRETSPMRTLAEIDDIDGLVSKPNEINVVRIIQEAMANVLKHADATEARVEIRVVDSQIQVSVRDNGKGFDTTKQKGGGLGLADISERVRILKGSLDVASEAGKGTVYSLRLPVTRDGGEHAT